MTKLKTLGALVIVGLAGVALVSAEQRGSMPGAVSGDDYAEIMNLYARYSQGSDFQDSELFLSAFSDDATIVRADGSSITGMAALRKEREERNRNRTGDTGRRHRTGSYLITPTPEGPTGHDHLHRPLRRRLRQDVGWLEDPAAHDQSGLAWGVTGC